MPAARPAPRIAVGPDTPWRWAVDAVEAGGGEVVAAEDAEALVWLRPNHPDRLAVVLDQAPSVRWVQLPWAGVEAFAGTGLFADGRVWTCGKGAYSEPVAEHALMLALAGLRCLPDRVRAGSWGEGAGVSLYDAPVTIVGGGGITDALVALLAPWRTPITVVRRHPRNHPGPGVVATVTTDGLLGALASAKVTFLTLALTPETAGIISGPELAAMAADAWLVNVARGAHVDTDALVGALSDLRIGGAALDVTDPEPLPDDHPLWRLPNCIITPHTANTYAMAVEVLSGRIADNVRRFRAGQPLIGVIDPVLGY